MKYNCLFCEENRFSLNKELSLPTVESIVYEDDNIYVTPDLFPLCLGHMLIITKKHYNSFASVPQSVYNSANKAKQFLFERMFKKSSFIIFEHGSVVEHSGGSSIDHAHIHMMPFKGDIKKSIELSGFIKSSFIIATYENLNNLFEQGTPYIYYQRNFECPVVYPVYNDIPSQFLRMLVAQKLKINYDWKISYRDGSLKELFCKSISLREE